MKRKKSELERALEYVTDMRGSGKVLGFGDEGESRTAALANAVAREEYEENMEFMRKRGRPLIHLPKQPTEAERMRKRLHTRSGPVRY